MRREKKYNSNNIKHEKILFICIFIILVIFVARALAKYIIKYQDIAEANATKFYFKSNMLDTEEKIYNYYDWDGKSEYNIEFELCNYEDELRYSSFDIPYKITINTDSTDIQTSCSINGEVTTEGILLSENSTKNNMVKLTINPTEGVEILNTVKLKITVTTVEPYEKTLIGTFNINVNKNNPYDVNLKSETDYEKLLITTYSYKGNIKIKYDKTKLILFTDNLEGITLNDDIAILNIESNSNYQVEFIKITTDSVELGTDIITET